MYAKIDKWSVLLCIVTLVAMFGFGYYLGSGYVHSNRGTVDNAGTELRNAKDGVRDTEGSLDKAGSATTDAQRTTDRITETNHELKKSVTNGEDAIRQGERVLEDIRQQRQKN